MTRWLLLIVATAVTFGLLGCRDESPIVSGQANGSPLSEKQVEALNLWMKRHSSSWSMIFAPPPAPSFIVAIKQASGKTGRIEFFSKENWDKVVVFWSVDPADNRIGSFSISEVADLRRQLSER